MKDLTVTFGNEHTRVKNTLTHFCAHYIYNKCWIYNNLLPNQQALSEPDDLQPSI